MVAAGWRQTPTELALPGWRRMRNRLGKGSVINETSVWCLSTGRVGTKSLARLMGLAGDARAVHEPKPKLFGLGRAARVADGVCDEVLREAIAALRGDAVAATRVYVETSPQVTFLAPHLDAVFPEARFIHLIREPFAVIESGLARGWYKGHPNDRWRIVPTDGVAHRSWPTWSQAERIAWLWAETNTWIHSFASTVPHDRMMALRSEDLFAPDVTLAGSLIEFACGRHIDSRSVARLLGRPFNKTEGNKPVLGAADRERCAAVLEQNAGRLLEAFGYATRPEA